MPSKTPLTDAQCAIVDSEAQRALCEDWLEAVDAAFARRLEESHQRLLEACEESIKLLGMDRPVNPTDILRTALDAAREIK